MAGSLGFASRLGGRGSVTAEQASAQMYSSGIVSGFTVLPATPTANMTVTVGGVAGTPDIMVATNAVGNNVFLKNRNTDAFTLSMTAPASNSVVYSIVGFTDDLSVATSDATSVADNPSSCNIIAVSGTSAASPTAPSDAQIRTAITIAGFTGSQAAYGVLGYVTITSATTSITAPNISQTGRTTPLSIAKLNGGSAGALTSSSTGEVTASAWTTYTPTIVGYSVNPTGVYMYERVGDTVKVIIRETTAGTSNSATTTYTLPVAAVGTVSSISVFQYGMAWVTDNNTNYAGGWYIDGAGPTVVSFGKGQNSSAGFTTSGNKRIIAATIIYRCAA